VDYSNDSSEAYHLTHTVLWASMSHRERREFTQARNVAARTWVAGRHSTLIDVSFQQARKLYNQNWDGCRDCWKENYRAEKERRSLPRWKP
jgi:hypothetical protein